MSPQPRSYVGQIIRVRATGKLAVIVSDNYSTALHYVRCLTTLRYLDGSEEQCRFIDVDTYPAGTDVTAFRTSALQKFPGLYLG
jgi:hypothetical protein